MSIKRTISLATLGVIVIVGLLLFSMFSVMVRPGEVAIKVDMYGGDKGVESEVMNTGRNFYNSITHDVVKFPTYVQQATYEAIQFQDVEGLLMSANVAVAYKFSEESIASLYEEYRKTPKQITNQYFPVWIRDAMVTESSTKNVDDLYGAGKEEYRIAVREKLRSQFQGKGIVIEDVYFTDGIAIPDAILQKVNAKIQADQIAQQKETELRQTEADVAKKIAEEEGKAKSRIIESESRRQAIDNLSQTLTPAYLQFRKLENEAKAIEAWNGDVPKIQMGEGGGNFLLDVSSAVQ
jgi:regulator of protease activity HflC (stomatin/prohibitin superfamily)